MAKGYSAKRGFSNGTGASARQMAMQQQIAKMQEDMAKRQQEVEEKTFTSCVGGGAVTATVSGKKQITSLVIKPEALDPEEAEVLQDMIMSAVNEALRQADSAMESSMDALTRSLNLGSFGSLGLSGL